MINGTPGFWGVIAWYQSMGVCDYLRLDGHGSRPLHSLCIPFFVLEHATRLCVMCCVNYIHGKKYMEKKKEHLEKE